MQKTRDNFVCCPSKKALLFWVTRVHGILSVWRKQEDFDSYCHPEGHWKCLGLFKKNHESLNRDPETQHSCTDLDLSNEFEQEEY